MSADRDCPKCGRTVPDGARFCSSCGSEFSDISSPVDHFGPNPVDISLFLVDLKVLLQANMIVAADRKIREEKENIGKIKGVDSGRKLEFSKLCEEVEFKMKPIRRELEDIRIFEEQDKLLECARPAWRALRKALSESEFRLLFGSRERISFLNRTAKEFELKGRKGLAKAFFREVENAENAGGSLMNYEPLLVNFNNGNSDKLLENYLRVVGVLTLVGGVFMLLVFIFRK